MSEKPTLPPEKRLGRRFSGGFFCRIRENLGEGLVTWGKIRYNGTVGFR